MLQNTSFQDEAPSDQQVQQTEQIKDSVLIEQPGGSGIGQSVQQSTSNEADAVALSMEMEVDRSKGVIPRQIKVQSNQKTKSKNRIMPKCKCKMMKVDQSVIWSIIVC